MASSQLARDFGIDAPCLQECDTEDRPNTLGALHLADSTKGNRLGLAIYYRKDRFTAYETQTFALRFHARPRPRPRA